MRPASANRAIASSPSSAGCRTMLGSRSPLPANVGAIHRAGGSSTRRGSRCLNVNDSAFDRHPAEGEFSVNHHNR